MEEGGAVIDGSIIPDFSFPPSLPLSLCGGPTDIRMAHWPCQKIFFTTSQKDFIFFFASLTWRLLLELWKSSKKDSGTEVLLSCGVLVGDDIYSFFHLFFLLSV